MKPNLFFIILIAISSIIIVSGDKKLNNNLCKNKKLTNGQQFRQGSCSQTIQGEIPSVNKMPSTLIIEPINGQILKSQQSFRVKTKTSNLITGFFTDPNEKYYAEPQQLKNGVIKGHSHVTIQKLDGNNLPDAKDFAFFKGLDQPDKNGILSVKVKGLSSGDYRICTLVSSFSHQPVIMPVAKRECKALIDFRNTWYKVTGLEFARLHALSIMQNGKKDNPSEADIDEIIDLYCQVFLAKIATIY
nr:8856_t:CDS:2 [Entrophospora candida]